MWPVSYIKRSVAVKVCFRFCLCPLAFRYCNKMPECSKWSRGSLLWHTVFKILVHGWLTPLICGLRWGSLSVCSNIGARVEAKLVYLMAGWDTKARERTNYCLTLSFKGTSPKRPPIRPQLWKSPPLPVLPSWGLFFNTQAVGSHLYRDFSTVSPAACGDFRYRHI